MTDSIQIGDKWYISARVAHSDQRAQMIKHDGTFAVLDRFGDIRPFDSGDGLYERDTRFLSRQELLINGVRPLFLNCNLKDDSSLLTVELMNPDLVAGDRVVLPKGMIHIFRAKLLWKGACYEHLRLGHHGLELGIHARRRDQGQAVAFGQPAMRGQARSRWKTPRADLGRKFIDQLLVSGFGHRSVYS